MTDKTILEYANDVESMAQAVARADSRQSIARLGFSITEALKGVHGALEALEARGAEEKN